MSELIRIVIDEVRKNCKKDPLACGYNANENAYEPLKLMQSVILQLNEVCLRYLHNSELYSLPSPGTPYPPTSTCAIRNKRRALEDRHTVIHDLNTIFNDHETSPSRFYAVFDGHAGQQAAAYSATHFHQYLAESKHFRANPKQALIDAFIKTDALFLEKCKIEDFKSGTTAVCALLRPKEKKLWIAWVGDSQAILSRQGAVTQCVNPHKASRKDERIRISKNGGNVIFWNEWRVNGLLSLSRAIGDAEYKPYISAQADIYETDLEGNEDFILLACDGLWDNLKEVEAAEEVYKAVRENPDDISELALHLAHLSKHQGSTDNISVIVVFLRDPRDIAAEPHWDVRLEHTMEAGFDSPKSMASTGGKLFSNLNSAEILAGVFSLDDYKGNNDGGGVFGVEDMMGGGAGTKPNMEADDDDDDDDLGPETDVDAVDDAVAIDNQDNGADSEQKIAKEIADIPAANKEGPLQAAAAAAAAHDAAQLVVDNVEESDSEDEWNYTKGNDKENIEPASRTAEAFVEPDLEVALINANPVAKRETEEEEDSMSNLNPDAAEFVPTSPTRPLLSPACKALQEEKILAQSPKRPPPGNNYDINLPEENDFKEEVKNKPGDLFSNGFSDNKSNSDNTLETMENLMNSKNTDDLDFKMETSSPTKSSGDFLFGPNASPFGASAMDQSKLSTQATLGDDSLNVDVTLGAANGDNSSTNPFGLDIIEQHVSTKEEDPMSMSFYQDKEDKESTNPFDLNKVQELPNDIDDFLEQSFTAGDQSAQNGPSTVITTDLDKKEEDLLGVKELPTSPISDTPLDVTSGEPIEAPEPTLDENLCANKQQDLLMDSSLDLSAPPAEQLSPELPANDLSTQSVELVAEKAEVGVSSPSPRPQTPEPEEVANMEYDTCTRNKEVSPSPEPAVAPEPIYPTPDAAVPRNHSPMDFFQSSANDFIHQHHTFEELNPIPDAAIRQQEQLFIPVGVSAPIVRNANPEDRIAEPMGVTRPIHAEPSVQFNVESPTTPADDITSSVKDDSPVQEPLLNFAQELSSAVQETITQEISTPIATDNLVSDAPPSVAPVPQAVVKPDAAVPLAAGATCAVVGTKRTAAVPPATKKAAPTTKTAASKPTAKATTITSKPATTAAAKARAPAAPTAAKAAPAKPLTSRVAASTTKSTVASKTTSATSAAAPKVPATRVKAPTSATSTAPRKPLTNGDVKPKAATAPIAKRPLTARGPAATAATASKTTTTTSSKVGATKPSPSAPRTRPATAPTTASAKTTTTTTKSIAPKPKPTALSSSRIAASKTTTDAKNGDDKAAALKAKPATSTVSSSKPRVPLSFRTNAVPKAGPDAEKQNKENVNKLTASRTAASRTNNVTMRKAGEKDKKQTPSGKPAPISKASAMNKSASAVKNKSADVSATENTSVTNGILNDSSVIIIDDSLNKSEDVPVKDSSPVENNLIIDNAQLAETTLAAD